MSQSYVGEIRMFAGSFAPAGWAFCDGTMLPISEYETLFNLIGTTYGGDGQVTFQLPSLSARLPVHMGTSPAGRTVTLGESGGVETVNLTAQQLPAHTHALMAAAAPVTASISNTVPSAWQDAPYSTVAPATPLASDVLAAVGGNQPHENLPPFLVITYIISLFGIYPSPT